MHQSLRAKKVFVLNYPKSLSTYVEMTVVECSMSHSPKVWNISYTFITQEDVMALVFLGRKAEIKM